MGLDSGKLKDGLIDALKKGEETNDVSGGEEGEKEAKYSEGDVAGFMADAIVAYASDAEIMLMPGPMLIPAAPSPLPSSSQNAKCAVQTADVGKAALESAISAGFAAGDAPLAMMGAGIVAYVAASFTLFQATAGHMATGAAIMPGPPLLSVASSATQASEGALEDWCDLVATAIHAQFLLTIFTGAGVGADGGLGAVVSTLQ
jgi:hypothetical protein